MPYVIALPKEDRRAVFGAVRNDPDLPGRGARRAAYREMVELLAADTFDVEAVRAVLARQAGDVGQVQAVAQAAWLDKVAAMSTGDRQAYAQRVQEVVSKGVRGRPKTTGAAMSRRSCAATSVGIRRSARPRASRR